jgi:hypothetical protein
MNKVTEIYANLYNIDCSIEENKRSFIYLAVSLFLLCFITFLFTGCACKEKVVYKYKYIEKPCPKLQTMPLDSINLYPEKPLDFNFTIKEK